jgi:hypothetical protein
MPEINHIPAVRPISNKKQRRQQPKPGKSSGSDNGLQELKENKSNQKEPGKHIDVYI